MVHFVYCHFIIFFAYFGFSLKNISYFCSKFERIMRGKVTYNCLSNQMNDKQNNWNPNYNQVPVFPCCFTSRII